MKTNFRKALCAALFSAAAATLLSGVQPAAAQSDSYYTQNRRTTYRTYNTRVYNNDYNTPIGVSLNGRLIGVGSVAPVQVNNRVLVPLRGVLESMGATVGFDSNTQTVIVHRGATQISLRIGSRQAFVNGQRRALDVPAQLFRGRTLVPLRFVSESLGANVSWNTAQRVVFISTADRTYIPQETVIVAPPVVVQPQVGEVYYPASTIGNGVVTLRGSVTRVLGGRRFEVITDRGDLIEVRAPQGTVDQFDVNDRVLISGEMTGNFFRANSFRQVRNSQTRRGALRGTVVARLSRTRLLVRTLEGRTVTVVTDTPFASDINVGDTVRIPGGQGESDFVRADRVVLVRNGSNTSVGESVDFVATVVRDDLFGDLLQVRGNNGVLYIVRYTDHSRFNRGDRVRIIGTARQGITDANRISIIRS
jgi:hypothetical protein